ncbi:alpha/beta hydrolase family protein [Gordonia jacobaea]|uniref:alpha/beta hydrolase family protein n=1 Tax=Gordonia jacobaea TaxID=122202 RepID=UPI003D73CD7B
MYTVFIVSKRSRVGRRVGVMVSAVAVVAATMSAVIGAPPASAAPSGPSGTVVSTEPLPARITVPGAVDAKRITYWTKGVRDAAALSSGAVYLPPGTPPKGGWPVIAWAHGTTGLADHCAYSIGGPVAVERDWEYLGSWMSRGYAVVASDYVGLGTPGNHPYLNGRVEAHSIVDSVKAARQVYPQLSRKWAVVGQSQGGGAAITTARYATQFGGKDLDYRGAVGTGVPAYIENLVAALGRPSPVRLGGFSPNTTIYVMYILSGLRTSFPEWNINSFLTPYGRYWVDKAETQCDSDNELGALVRSQKVDPGKLLSRPLSDIPGFQAKLTDYMGIPESGYDKPFFIGQGGLDTDVNTPGVLLLVSRLKANNQPVTFRFYPDKDHSGTVNASKVDSIPFVDKLFR